MLLDDRLLGLREHQEPCGYFLAGAEVVRDGRAAERWHVAARKRRITI